MSAMLLSGAVAFTACSSDDELAAEGNPQPTVPGQVVKTSFALNIPYGGPDTRMTAGNTQNGSPVSFLGMDNIHLLSFASQPTAGNEVASSVIPLTDLTTTDITTSQSSKIYNDVNVPVGTKGFLFYATAPMGTDAAGMFEKGTLNDDKLVAEGTTNLSQLTFSLEPVLGNNVTVSTNDEAIQLLAVLNAVENVSNWSNSSDDEFKALHDAFVTMKAGSANNIKLALQNLYNTVERWATATSESNEKTAALAIRTAITANYNSSAVFTVTGLSAPYTLSTTLTFPQNLNLPDGAVELAYKADGTAGQKFSYVEDATGSGNVFGANKLNATDICFPTSLYYFINTDLAASNDEVEAWPNTTTNWVANTAPWNASGNSWGNAVTATTRSIALKKNIQYGVANLKLTVKCKAAQLQDKGTESNPAVWVNVPSEGFPVTAVLVGGQPTLADWKLEPATSTQMDKTIYDKCATDDGNKLVAKAGTASTPNYTLVLSDTLVTAQKVNFAVELENNSGVEFRGADGIIPVGGKFYLVGQLDPNAQGNSSKPADWTAAHIFGADHTTTANVTISSLAAAYNTIPDLRATKMELGLSVDLSWAAGMSFDVEIGQ